ncbi:MAG: WecB/TagA/CpsF family glycosyltransferase [Bacteroidota bacterium]
MQKFKTVLGFKVLNESYSEFLKQVCDNKNPTIVNTISPNSYGISTYDKDFEEALKNSTLVLDGVYFGLASILSGNGTVVENQGPHITKKTLKFANKNHLRVFFLGSATSTLQKIERRVNREYPNITVGYHSPPFKKQFSGKDNQRIAKEINKFGTDILLIGMTCPKQEKWINENKEKIDFKLSMSIGGVFDWYAGTRKPVPQIWWDLKLGWLYRIAHRPGIIKRNFWNTLIYLRDLIKEILGIRKK